jgi:ankyrin repeat protein
VFSTHDLADLEAEARLLGQLLHKNIVWALHLGSSRRAAASWPSWRRLARSSRCWTESVNEKHALPFANLRRRLWLAYVHRDIKPANLLVFSLSSSETVVAKLTDLSSVRIAKGNQQGRHRADGVERQVRPRRHADRHGAGAVRSAARARTRPPTCTRSAWLVESYTEMSLNVDLKTFCDHAAHGRLADVQRMLESGELRVDVNGNLNDALVRAAENGHVDVVDYLLRHAMFDPSANDNCAIRLAAANGHLAVVERLLHDERVDPSAYHNRAIQCAAENGYVAVVKRLLQDLRVDPSAYDNYVLRWAAYYGFVAVVERLLRDPRVDPSIYENYAVRSAAERGHLAVVERLLQDKRVDPSANNNYAVRWAAESGHLAVVERLLQDPRVDPSANDNYAVRWAALEGHLPIVERLLEDDRVDAAVAIQHSRPEDCKRFECRKRLTEICIALQDLALPAWVTVQILDAARPWSTLPFHRKWKLVCAVKHFHDKHPAQ